VPRPDALKGPEYFSTPSSMVCQRQTNWVLGMTHNRQSCCAENCVQLKSNLPKTGVAAREPKERKARPMNNENEDHQNGGWGILQIQFTLCSLRSFAAIQFRSPG
jgi:hypothetical protein